jgi:hypothetical protein
MASTIKVNNIQNQCGANIANKCGTTITLGASGDTVTLASGASQTGFGRTGTVDWDTTAKTASFTAVSGNGYFVNTTSGTITVTLPASPSAGDIVALADYAGTSATNNITIARNGSNINGAASDLTISKNNSGVTLVYVDGTQGWKATETSNLNDIELQPEYIVGTGGNTVSTIGNYKVHIFTGPGTFTVCSVGNPVGSDTITATVVGGGAGGGNRHGGGGGAGGLTVGQNIPVTATDFPISIGGGGGGSSSPSNRSSAGSNSTAISFTAIGGGPAGSQGPNTPGLPGGSGGGSAVGGAGGCVGPAPAGAATQPTQPQPAASVFNAGSAGGQGGVNPGPDDGGGGGGGATSAGIPSNPSNPNFSDGGAGKDVTPFVNGAPGYPNSAIYAGGGGGGANNNPEGGTGGTGGGGDGAPSGAAGSNGTTNTGGGGGGSGTAPQVGGNGGSGIVIIEYKFQ